MEKKYSCLVVIPARGGSKGIPRKNLRNLNGKPLIYYAITSALNSTFKPDVVVSTDDKEIAAIALQLGADVVERDESIANDVATLDPVIFDAYVKTCRAYNTVYDFIITLQPTSPLLKTASLDSAITQLSQSPLVDTIISAKNDTHLTWVMKDGCYYKNYEKRVNRQQLPQVYKETGGFLITRSEIISNDNRIGNAVDLYILNDGEGIDIDSSEDWAVCEYHLRRKKILFVVRGNAVIGLGHAYNTLLLANDLVTHDIKFLVSNDSELAYKKISSNNYFVQVQQSKNIADDVIAFSPDVVINDCLDTSSDYILTLKRQGIQVVNFEDLGSGAKHADLVINAIYPEKDLAPKHYFGHKYFLVRDEFLLAKKYSGASIVKRVLITFGGVDPNNFTLKVCRSIQKYCLINQIEVNVVLGFGYAHNVDEVINTGVRVHKNVSNIATLMSGVDLIFTSAGRTLYEIASLHVPAIVLAQNERELTHLFGSIEHGFINLGLGEKIEDQLLVTKFIEVCGDYDLRCYMSSLMRDFDVSGNRARVLTLINNLLELS
jgi:CMP-N-acetylneuraminic acid synthetase/spore coat polysaccharide biosynthesis predicted glycosyltransferase SpsG